MGRKSEKALERKKKKKELNAQIAVSQAKVDEANLLDDPLEALAAFKKFERNGLSLQISCVKRPSMDQADLDWAFQLIKSNMQTLYEQSESGWSDDVKYEEMSEDVAWYLIVKDCNDQRVAFSHFRFDMDYDDEVLYCYELQLIPEVRRKGLGKFMMQILELLAFKNEMKKVMLTVFKHNREGYNFYTKTMKYETDDTSPAEYVYEDPNSYTILSKKMQPKKSVTKAAASEEETVNVKTKAVAENLATQLTISS